MKPIITIKYYETASGKQPFWEWYDSIDTSIKAIIQARIERIEAGNLGETGRVGTILREIKFARRSGYRIYYISEGEGVIRFLCAGNKDTQGKDIRKAKAYVKELIERGKK